MSYGTPNLKPSDVAALKNVSTALPPMAVAMLQRAARTPITQEDPLARVKAIEVATKRVKTLYPQFFR